MKRVLALPLILCLLVPSLHGCGIGVLAAGVGYASSSNKEADAKKAEVRRKYTENYTSYRVELEKINLEREKAGLQPTSIPTFEEWIAQQGVSEEDKKVIAERDQTQKQLRQE